MCFTGLLRSLLYRKICLVLQSVIHTSETVHIGLNKYEFRAKRNTPTVKLACGHMRPQLTCMFSIRDGACRTFRQVEHSEKYINVCSSDVIPTTASTTTALYSIAYYIITNSTMSSNSSLSSTRSNWHWKPSLCKRWPLRPSP